MGESLPVYKMNGIGNRIAVVDLRAGGAPLTAAEALVLAGPSRGLGFDQLMALHPGRDGADVVVAIYNSDGTPAGACGNGMRCVADVLFAETDAARLVAETAAGALVMTRGPRPATYTVDMGPARFGWQDIPLAAPVADTMAVDVPLGDAALPGPASCASMGNPHAIFWVDDIHAYDLARFGPLLENHPIFPERANITLAHVADRGHIAMRTWERGAGLTRACGSAACATAVAAARLRRTGRTVAVSLPGGDLVIEWRERDDHVLMTGTATFEYEGRFDPALFADVA